MSDTIRIRITPEDRRRMVAQRLEQVQMEHARLQREEKRIENEILALDERIDGENGVGKRRLPMAKVLVASPCDEPWAKMTGDEKKRFCQSCEKHVHNLSAMTTSEVAAFLEDEAKKGECIRLYERADGTVLTADCPVGAKRRRTRGLMLSLMGAGACALFAFTSVALTMHFMEAEHRKHPVVVEVPRYIDRTIMVPPALTVAPVALPPVEKKLPYAGEGKGWILVSAPDDTKIYDGKRLLGKAPLVVTLPEGEHVLRAEGTNVTNGSETRVITVVESKQHDVSFTRPIHHLLGRPPMR